MKAYRPYKLLFVFTLIFSFTFSSVKASHIVGDDFTYVYQGDTTIGTTVYHKYQVTLALYVDCLNGDPQAIAQDNPAYFAVYANDSPYIGVTMDSVNYTSSISIPIVNAPSPCGGVPTPYPTCLLKKTFVNTYYLKPNAAGYIVSYQRCCRNAEIVNIVDPGNNGATYYCNIPGDSIVNNSAVFKNYPPQIICVNLPLIYDNSATDADGDSLSYGFCAALNGANGNNVKPDPPLPPPYDSVVYISSPYSSQVPFTGMPSITLDPVTGIMTGIPNTKGRYLVTVYCNEWRSGVVINTIKREYQFIVADCTPEPAQPYAGNDTTILAGDSVQFIATGGSNYYWTPSTYLNDSAIANPVGYFPIVGNFTYTLHGVSDSGCPGAATRTIFVLKHSLYRVPNAFTPNDDNINDYLKPISLLNASLVSFKVFNRDGNLVYSGGPNDRGWDGTYKGKKQPLGAYMWELTYRDNYSVERKESGNVTLIR